MKVKITFIPHEDVVDARHEMGITEEAYLRLRVALVEIGDDIAIVREEEDA